MILNEKPLSLEVAEGLKSTNFRIKASRKAFDILSAGLYADAVKSIIRELSTNAADSHIAAGKKDVPFTVHLPNSLEPYFAVKDNGVGLSEEQINTIYTTYFDSDKTESNEVTGCLGLGSKSPFSYTDQFTVETRFNGNKYIFNVHKDANGLPAYVKLHESVTTECNGVEVKFPVNANDFYAFRTKAQDVLSWFTVRPTVTGDKYFVFAEREYMRKTEKYGLTKDKVYNSHVVMGNVAYQLNVPELKAQVKLDDLYGKVLDWGCDIFVPIGAVDVTASREKISYDADSVAVLKDRLTAAVEDLKVEVENIITKAPTIWQARTALYKAKHSILGQVKDIMELEWKGQSLSVGVTLNEFDNPPEAIILNLRKSKFKKNNTSNVVADGNPIIVDDLDRGGYTRAIHYLVENSHEKAYYLTDASKDFLDRSGMGEVAIRTSTMPKSERQARTAVPRRKGSTAKLNEFKTCYSTSAADYWQAAEVDLTEGGIYVEISYFRYKTAKSADLSETDKYAHPSNMREIVGYLQKLGYEEKIYGIRPTDVKILEKHDGWVSLDAFVEAVLEENDDLAADVTLIDQWDMAEFRDKLIAFYNFTFAPDSVFGQYLEKMKSVDKALINEKARIYRQLARCFKLILPSSNELNKAWRKVTKKYPLLQHINWYNNGTFANEVVHYIEAVEK